MNIIYFSKGTRGTCCLHALLQSGYKPQLLVLQREREAAWYEEMVRIAKRQQISWIDPENPNSSEVEVALRSLDPDLFILGGYGQILKKNILDVPRVMSINLHGGALPKYRGSSPLNWALINGETSFTLSIIQVDAGVDTGDILLERTFEISQNDTIHDLHRVANREFPQLLLSAVRQVESGTYRVRRQDRVGAVYFPLRFPDDGLILWDLLTAQQIHNRIRALTEPYPCAFTFYGARRVKLLSSQLPRVDHRGEPGRVYKKSQQQGLLVCASDRCLWIRQAVFAGDRRPLGDAIQRYDRLATVREAALGSLLGLATAAQLGGAAA